MRLLLELLLLAIASTNIDADGKLVSVTYGNQLGGEDGHATLDGISARASRFLDRSSNM